MFDHLLLHVNLAISCFLTDYICTYSSVFRLWYLVSSRLLLTLFLNMWRMLVFIQEMLH